MPSDTAPAHSTRISRRVVESAGRQAQTAQRDERVAAPVGEPRVAGDDRPARAAAHEVRVGRALERGREGARGALRSAGADRLEGALRGPGAERGFVPLGRHEPDRRRRRRDRRSGSPGRRQILGEVEPAGAFLARRGSSGTSRARARRRRWSATRSRARRHRDGSATIAPLEVGVEAEVRRSRGGASGSRAPKETGGPRASPAPVPDEELPRDRRGGSALRAPGSPGRCACRRERVRPARPGLEREADDPRRAVGMR